MCRAAFEEIKQTCQLPSPTGVAMKIVELIGDERSTMHDLAEVVASDPATATRILKYVNSPIAGVGKEIVSIRRAVTLMGMVRVKGIALSFSLVNASKDGPCRAFDYEGFWQESSARAAAARHLAHRLGCCQSDEAFTCGLLAHIGRLAFATASPFAYSEAINSVSPGDTEALMDIEREMFELDHRQFSGELLRYWGLPEHLCEAVRMRSGRPQDFGAVDEGDRLPWVLELAQMFAELHTSQTIRRSVLSSTLTRAASAGVRPDTMDSVFGAIGSEWRDLGEILDVKLRRLRDFGEVFGQAV